NPMLGWHPLMGFFLDEVIRHEALGNDTSDLRCGLCHKTFTPGDPASPQLFKCGDCGQYLQCEHCCLSHHRLMPLHVIREWNGDFWKPSTLSDLGLVYQLGHGGLPCPYPDNTVRKMTVIKAPFIHEVQMCFCKCSRSDYADNLEQLMRNAWYPATVTDPGTCATFESLEAYRLYNVVGNMNVRDFITSLERMTDTTATLIIWQDRYKQFQRMARQWSFLQRLKRAGRAHDPAGVGSTALGELAVRCWACPHDSQNLPDGWRDVDSKYQFLYMLLLAVDANFRPKNRIRNNEIDDPTLGPGWGYWVEPQKYQEHLKKYVNEKDVSTCIAFAALLQKDTRLTSGLRVSGVGGCVCARHECMRPNGLGDLQKGERYFNMDFIVLSALAGFSLLLLTISYDIACQWKIQLAERNTKLPEELRLPLDAVKLQCALPVWHAGSHNGDCAEENSLSFKRGVGKTNGEGIERTWSGLNPTAFSTKDAGRGVQADVLEGKIDNHNHLKNMGQGQALRRKMVVAIAERDKQIAAFKIVSKTIEGNVKKMWRKMIEDWEADPSKSNPYTLTRKDCPTEAEVRLDVRKDEDALTAGRKAPLHGCSATAFLTASIQIEDAQQRIITQLRGTALMAADRENKIEEWRHALLVKIGKFCVLQKIYMPGAARALADTEAERDPDLAAPRPEKIKLLMPSQMDVQEESATRGCVTGLPEMEAKLRVGQCNNSLVSLRSRLHAKRHLIGFRNANVTGQVQATKAQMLITQVGERADWYADRYWRGRTAVVALKGAVAYPHLRQLKPDDVQLDGDAGESDAAAWKKLGMINAGRGACAPRNTPGTSKRVMSWIWTAPGMLENEEERLHESIRMEWTRALARKTRWIEEVQLLREEMRRVLRYLGWQAQWWQEQAALRAEVSSEVAQGLRSYALKQVAWNDRLADFFCTEWNMPAVTAAQHLLAEETGLDTLFAD
ncbi:hypothetical protein B0H19DRAFT_946380, partial [Mycena capillaripes]